MTLIWSMHDIALNTDNICIQIPRFGTLTMHKRELDSLLRKSIDRSYKKDIIRAKIATLYDGLQNCKEYLVNSENRTIKVWNRYIPTKPRLFHKKGRFRSYTPNELAEIQNNNEE